MVLRGIRSGDPAVVGFNFLHGEGDGGLFDIYGSAGENGAAALRVTRSDSSGEYDIGVRRSGFEWDDNEKRGQVLDAYLAILVQFADSEDGIRVGDVKVMSTAEEVELMSQITGGEVKQHEAHMMDGMRQSVETRRR